ncbi:MAG: hypothetical protein JXA17_04035 [Dehalococcoidales bacterium]|nr:hypothetical protein [Dehalococcoidales bacterium]
MNLHAAPGLLIILAIMLVFIAGCTSTTTSLSTQPLATQYPIEIVSISEITYENGGTVAPGGPTIKITLKNISEEPIVTLNVTLEEGGPRSFDYDFDVNTSNPLFPNERISSERRCIGGGWGGGITYAISVNGTMLNGENFAFVWEPSD